MQEVCNKCNVRYVITGLKQYIDRGIDRKIYRYIDIYICTLLFPNLEMIDTGIENIDANIVIYK